MQSANS